MSKIPYFEHINRNSKSRKPTISIIIPTYNRLESLYRTLKSIVSSTFKDFEIIIIDMGGSIGHMQSFIQTQLGNEISIRVLKVDERMYVSGSINEALHYVNGDYILICADDVVVERDTIENLVKCLSSHKHIGIICPLCYYLRRPDRIWWAGSKIDLLTSRTYKYGIDLPLPNSDIFETDSFTTIALIRRELFYDNGKLYFVDPKEFPIHNEEADFSFRARLKGWRVCVTKSAKAYHDISLPEEHNLARLFHVHTGSRAYYVARNRIIFQKKYSKLWQFLIFILFFNWLFAIYYLRIILLKSDKPLPERLKIAYSYCRGLLSGIKWVLTVR